MRGWTGGMILVMALACGCGRRAVKGTEVSVVWAGGRAVGLTVHGVADKLEVRLAGHGGQPAIAGDTRIGQDSLLFTPLIPFTRGLEYEVLVDRRVAATIRIPVDTAVPVLTGIFPSVDTVPENLLKIYLHFSRPMREGRSLEYVRMVGAGGDTLRDALLRLSAAELWNEAGTELTLWLDPGRIKRGLIPNRKMGPPLVSGRRYRLVVLAGWPDQAGTPLGRDTFKNFFTGARDSLSPSPRAWRLELPVRGSREPLRIAFGEALDHALVQHTLRVIDPAGLAVPGTVLIDDREISARFVPDRPWAPGLYTLLAEARLEDLAGNNCNRLFDVDLRTASPNHPQLPVVERKWTIK